MKSNEAKRKKRGSTLLALLPAILIGVCAGLSGIYLSELFSDNEGNLPQNDTIGFDVWGSVYCAAQTDMTNYLPILDVNEDLYIRYDEPITRKEAIIACKRL